MPQRQALLVYINASSAINRLNLRESDFEIVTKLADALVTAAAELRGNSCPRKRCSSALSYAVQPLCQPRIHVKRHG